MLKRLCRVFLFLLVLLGVVVSPVAAAPTLSLYSEVKGRAAAASGFSSAEHACVVLVLDSSGSMEENDPTFLRNTGAKLFIALLDDGDSVGVVRFSSSAIRLTPELVTLDSPQDKQALMELLADVPPDGYTDIQAALAEAAALLNEVACEQRFIVLLSDGHPDLAGGIPHDYESTTLESATALKAPVYGIALTKGGESGLLYALASATDPAGVVLPAQDASDLLDAYLEVIARLKDRTIIGKGETVTPGFALLPLELGLSQYVSRATYIVSKPESVSASLIAPGGDTLSGDDPRLVFQYAADPRFAVITVDSPPPGDWGFSLNSSGFAQARAILRSRLRVVIQQPAFYAPLNEPLPLAVSLVEEGLDGQVTTIIGAASFSARITRPDGTQDEIDRLYDDGTAGDRLANDGLFGNAYVRTDIPGEYQITITGYKGLIPVKRALSVQIVAFPKVIVMEPAEQHYDVRGQPIPLAISLEGGDPPALDTGAFIAQITTPGGENTTVSLENSGDVFRGEYSPRQDGQHTVEYLPQDATYKGVPYALSDKSEFDVRLIPSIWYKSEEIDLGDVEIQAMSSGLEVVLDVVSSSPQAETFEFDVLGQTGLAVQRLLPAQIPPGESRVYLTLVGEVEPGDYTATLLIMGREGLDLSSREIPLRFSAYQPSLAVNPEVLDLGVIREDRLVEGEQAVLTFASHSYKDELVSLSWEGPEGVSAEYDDFTLPALQTGEAPVRILGSNVGVGEYSGDLIITSREGVEVTPAAVAVRLKVVPVPWCSRWCVPLIAAGAVTVIGTVVAGSYLGSRSRPWGAFKPLKVPRNQPLPADISLAAAASSFRAGRVVIGSGRGADIRIMDGGVRPQHAVVKVVPHTVTERIGKPPRSVRIEKQVNVVENLGGGLVKVNSLSVPKGRQSVPLRSGMQVEIGEYLFAYHE